MLIKNLFHFHGGGKKFYPLFQKQSELIVQAAQLLEKIIAEEQTEKKKELARGIKKIEKEGDIIDSQISNTLYKAQLVPFEREDIQKLGSILEKLLDMIHDSSKKIVIYNPHYIDSSWKEIGKIILNDAKNIEKITALLPNHKKNSQEIQAECKQIKEAEQEVDDMYEVYMSYLFENEKNGVELTKCKNIAQSLEDTTDVAKEIADCIKMIIIKEA